MKEPYKKGIANHLGPESCADSRKAGREALTGAQAGWVLSREMELISGSRRSRAKRKATGWESIARDDHHPARSKTPDKLGNSMHENRESPGAPAGRAPAGRRDERDER